MSQDSYEIVQSLKECKILNTTNSQVENSQNINTFHSWKYLIF